MLPIRALRESVGELLAADVAFLASVAANKIALFTGLVTPNEALTLAAFTLATFAGSTPKSGIAGTQAVGIDPDTNDQIISILSPAGGWRWECTATPGAPEGIMGYVLIDSTELNLIGMVLLENPVQISMAGQFVDLGAVTMRIVRNPIS